MSYTVTVSHPTGFHGGEHLVHVTHKRMTAYYAEHRYCNSAAFGCSRDYYDAVDDEQAIRKFLAEHGCTVVSIVPAI